MINIIGAGLAGLSCAYTLSQNGIPCNLISVQPSERAQSVMAEGGINASLNTMGEGDTVAQHIADTLRGGVDLADPNAVEGLCGNAPGIVNWLADLGVPFPRNDSGIVQRNFGGQKKKRTAYVKSSTGKMLMTALIDGVRQQEAKGIVTRFSHHRAERLLTENGRCAGVLVRDLFSGETVVFSGAAVLCCGGMNGLFRGATTGTVNNTSDLTATLFTQGVELANPEFVQYHPTTIAIPGKRFLISEAARGEGGRLYVKKNGVPWYFMEERYPELGNLMPRDVVSAEIVRVTAMDECEKQVYLDMTGIGKDVWKRRLSDLRDQCFHYLSIDPVKEPVPVSPGIHYFMGGVFVDEQHRTSLPGLLAAGECACQYHGANRLGGNSLLGALYGGRKAAETAMEFPECRTEGRVETAPAAPEETVSLTFADRVCESLLRCLPIIRNERDMTEELQTLQALYDTAQNDTERRRLLLAETMVKAALFRKESRGAHKRSDYPEPSEAFRKTTVARYLDGKIELFLRDIPKRREIHETDT